MLLLFFSVPYQFTKLNLNYIHSYCPCTITTSCFATEKVHFWVKVFAIMYSILRNICCVPGLWSKVCRLSGGLCRPAAGCGWHWAAGESHRPCCRRRWCWPRLQTPGGKLHHRRRSRTTLREDVSHLILYSGSNTTHSICNARKVNHDPNHIICSSLKLLSSGN